MRTPVLYVLSPYWRPPVSEPPPPPVSPSRVPLQRKHGTNMMDLVPHSLLLDGGREHGRLGYYPGSAADFPNFPNPSPKSLSLLCQQVRQITTSPLLIFSSTYIETPPIHLQNAKSATRVDTPEAALLRLWQQPLAEADGYSLS